MDVCDLKVNIKPREAGSLISKAIVAGSISGTFIDQYERIYGDKQVYVIVLEKFYYRTSNRASMTVTIDNLEGITVVHAVASGSSGGHFSGLTGEQGAAF